MLESIYGVVGGLRRLWVDCNPSCGSVKHDYGHCVDGNVRILVSVVVLDQMISCDLVTELNWSLLGIV